MTVRAIVKPELLRWAREDAGFSTAEAAKKVRVKVERLEGWERGELQPTVNQLRTLGRVYKRPLAVFYLSEPPTTFQALRDFRRLPSGEGGEETPELRLEIRKAQYRREVALSLYRALAEEPPSFALSASLRDDPEELAGQIRRALEVDLDLQLSWKGPYPALSGWRERLEAAGVLVFQMTGVEVEEARGFSLGDFPLPVVAVNSKDSPRGRIFSMLHEAAHLLIRQTGLCDLEEQQGRPEDRRIEVFCNHVAGATLVPARHLLAEDRVRKHGATLTWSDEEIVALANRYSVSRETLLRRLVILGRASRDHYRRQRARYLAEYRERVTGGFAPVPVRTLSQVGRLYARLVLDSFHQEKITSSDVSEFLGVRLKHMPQLEQEVLGRNREFGTAV